MRWGALAAVFVVALAGAAAVMAATAGNRSSSRPSDVATPSVPGTDTPRPGRAAAARTGLREQDPAVDRVLAYTPFVRTGLPLRRMIALRRRSSSSGSSSRTSGPGCATSSAAAS
jgi:hypothetical protein